MTLCDCRSGTELTTHRKLVQFHDPAEGPREGSGFQLVIESSLSRGSLRGTWTSSKLSPFANSCGSATPYDKVKGLGQSGQPRSVECSSMQESESPIWLVISHP